MATSIEIIAGQFDALGREYDSLLSVLARVQSGEIRPEQVRVDLSSRTWRVVCSPAEADLIREVQDSLLLNRGCARTNGKIVE